MFSFEKLEVWQLAVEFCDDIYRITRGIPANERFGLSSQLRRAAVSIAANTTEGSDRGSKKDFARFVEIAYGSLAEVVTELKIAKRQGMLSESDLKLAYDKAERLGQMLSRLRSSLNASTPQRSTLNDSQ